ncbi:MAG: iron ABC transporter permease [Cytophagales bacterium]|nr:iron ABC transporter permease [Cytophagales bacterium]
MPIDSALSGNGGWRNATLGGLALALLAAFIFSLALGSVHIPVSEIVTILTGGESAKASWSHIVLTFRLPKALTAVLAGAALAVSGLQMQTLFRNPLADPFILGISAGASLGVALVVLSTGAATGFLSSVGLFGDLGLIMAAVSGAAAVTGLVMLIAQRMQQAMTLLLLGLMMAYATGAVVSILIYFSVPEQIQAYIAWTFGSFGGVTGRHWRFWRRSLARVCCWRAKPWPNPTSSLMAPVSLTGIRWRPFVADF